MRNIIVAGSGTDVGKTVASAVLTLLVEGEYWKPIQSGPEDSSDTSVMKNLIDPAKYRIHTPAYSFKAPLSPHHAARLEDVVIDRAAINPPKTTRPLIIEGVGGAYVPILTDLLTIDLFKNWNCQWVIVSKHYLGSINHTLLTIEALKKHGVDIAGIIFNGEPNSDTESAILTIAQIPFLGRLLPETTINKQTIQRYAKQWKQQSNLLIP